MDEAICCWLLVPLLLFVVCVAWSFALAVRRPVSHPIIRVGVLILYFMVADRLDHLHFAANRLIAFLIGWGALALTVAFSIRLWWAGLPGWLFNLPFF